MSKIDDADKLEALHYWQQGVKLTYPINPNPSPIDNPNLYSAFWEDLSEKENTEMRKYPFRINGVWRRVVMAGWQWFINGMTQLHGEKNGEDINVLSGHIVMGKTDSNRNCSTDEVYGLIPRESLNAVQFAVAIGDNAAGMEYLALYALSKLKVAMPQLHTEDNFLHQVVTVGEACALVVKHAKLF